MGYGKGWAVSSHPKDLIPCGTASHFPEGRVQLYGSKSILLKPIFQREKCCTEA